MPDTAPITVVPPAASEAPQATQATQATMTPGFTPIVPPAVPASRTAPPSAAPLPGATSAVAYPTVPYPTIPSPTVAYPTVPYPTATYPTAPVRSPALPFSSAPPPAAPGRPGAPWAGGPRDEVPWAAPAEHPGPARALGIAALMLGVLAILGAAIPVVNLASAALAAIGTGLGIAALFQLNRSRGIALSGAILSVVALTASVALATVYTGVATSAAGGLFDGLSGVGSLPGIVEDYEDESIAPADADGPSGISGDPIPLGEMIVVTRDGEPRWEITLTEATYDAEEEVLLGSGASDVATDLTGAPAQYAYVAADITYLGEESASMYEEVYVCFSTPDETYYCAGETMAVAPGTDLTLVDEVEPGQTFRGNFLVAIPASAEDDGHWAVAGEWTEFLEVAAS